jgi:hypothetical protein
MEGSYLLGGDGLLASLVKLFNGFLVVTEIFLAADEDDGEATAEMNDFGDPLVSTCQRFSLSGESSGEKGAASYLLLDVVEGVGRVDSEADQDDMGIGVGERSETVVIFLSSRIP